jgi:hypothetical protein
MSFIFTMTTHRASRGACDVVIMKAGTAGESIVMHQPQQVFALWRCCVVPNLGRKNISRDVWSSERVQQPECEREDFLCQTTII